jgi:hypothetical protein
MAAGLGYKEFSTGDVLTAADANGYLASQVVMVFASAAARTSAIASPQEGMISYLKDTNSTEYYSGSAWVAISGGASGLVLITTLSPSGVTEVTADSIFTSTYENYLIEIALDQTANSVLYAQLRSGGSNLTSATYTYDAVGGPAQTAQTAWEISANTGSGCTLVSALTLFRPQLANPTFGVGSRMASVDNFAQQYGYINTSAAAYDGLRIFGSSGNITGKIRIYGLAN